MKKECCNCRYFHMEDEESGSGNCTFDPISTETYSDNDACEWYAERSESKTECKSHNTLEEVMVSSLIKAAEDGNNADTILHMVWFCEYLRREIRDGTYDRYGGACCNQQLSLF